MKTKSFSVEVDNQTVELMVNSPSLNDQKEASKIYNQTFTEALKAKAVVRAKLDDLLTEQGLWDANKQMKFSALQNEILEGERKLAKGGISLSEAKSIALNMRKLREDLRDLISVKTNLDTHTAEGQADNARFNCLVSCCTVYKDTKKPFFKSYEDYLNRSSEPAAIAAAQHLANMLYGLEDNYESKLPENKFLKEYKFVNDDLKLINKEGKLVDSEGRLVDDNNRYINDKGEYVDKDGNLLSKDGEYIFDFKPFLDDEGKPVKVEQSQDSQQNEQEQPDIDTKE